MLQSKDQIHRWLLIKPCFSQTGALVLLAGSSRMGGALDGTCAPFLHSQLDVTMLDVQRSYGDVGWGEEG